MSDSDSNAGPKNNPSNTEFHRRILSEAAILGNIIYFDGGEVSQVQTPDNIRFLNPVNATLAIDLSKSWDVEDVEIVETAYESNTKEALSDAALLIDKESGSFFSWGGWKAEWGSPEFPSEQVRQSPELWRFRPSGTGDGRGTWINETSHDRDGSLYHYSRTGTSVVVNTPDTAFIFGGSSNRRTTRDPEGSARGYVMFDFKTKVWSRNETVPYAKSRSIYGGGGVFAPKYGPNGLIFVFGGVGHKDDVFKEEAYLDFNTIHFMDPATKRWYSQETTGSPPDVRLEFCAVGVESRGPDHDRLDIFIFGGRNELDRKTFNDIRVLSLPAFHWSSVTYPNPDSIAYGRYTHSCSVVGQRQLLSWGGMQYRVKDKSRDKDPLPRGIGIFDLSAWEWKDSYNAHAEAYTQHQAVKSWYDDGNLATKNWSVDVRDLFLPELDSPEGNSVPVGAIVGGAVGGVVVIALLLCLLWFLRRRRHGNQRPKMEPEGTYLTGVEMKNAQPPDSKPGFQYQSEAAEGQASELPAGYLPSLMDNTPVRYEVDGTSAARDTGR